MDITATQIIVFVGSAISGIVGFMIKDVYRRLTSLEKSGSVTEPQVRQIIADKVDPIKEDLSEIKSKLDYLFNLFYSSKIPSKKDNTI